MSDFVIDTKKRALFASFSESETHSLARVAKALMASGGWNCQFLILHQIGPTSPVLDELFANGTVHTVMSEIEFCHRYGRPYIGQRITRPIRPGTSKRQKIFDLLFVDLDCYDPHYYPVESLKAAYKKIKSPRYILLSFQLIAVMALAIWVLVYNRLIHYLSLLWYQKYKVTEAIKKKLSGMNPAIYTSVRAFYRVWRFRIQRILLLSKYYADARNRREINRLRKTVSAAEHFFRENRIDVVILAKDSAYYTTIAFIQAAKNSKISSVVIPYDRADSDTLANDRAGHPQHVIASDEAKRIAQKYPHWVYEYQGQQLLLVAPATVNAIEHLKLTPSNPWFYNCSRADRIFLETEEDKQFFLVGGVSDNQLAVIGAPYMDKIDELKSQASRFRASLCAKYHFETNKPFVIASVPPNKICQREVEIEFKSYHELIDAWAAALTAHLDCNLIYSLHPLTNPSEVAFIEKKGGLIVRQPLEELLAVADLYVVDCSGTTRWARYAGVDVIDYDIYRYNLWFNSKVDGVRHVTTYSEFVSELKIAQFRMRQRMALVQQFESGGIAAKARFSDRLSSELESVVKSRRGLNVV